MDIIPQNDTTYKQCPKCEQWLPATLEYFSPREGRLASRCKACQRLWWRDANPEPKWSKHLQDGVPEGYKRCVKCQQVKPIEQFNTTTMSKDGRRPRCKECYAEENEQRKQRYITERPPLPSTKFCPGCSTVYPLDMFPNEKNRKDGHGPLCIACQKAHNIRYRQENKEQLTAYEHNRSATPERREGNRNSHRKTAEEPETKAKRRIYTLRYNQAHPLVRKELDMRRNARKKQTQVEVVDYNRILARDGFWCYICKRDINPVLKTPGPGSLAFDHKVPLTPRPGEPQGTHTEDNIHPAHSVCNIRKKNIPFEKLTPFLRRGLSQT